MTGVRRQGPHGFRRHQALLAEHPALLNATWDWGGGDFETGLGGASHMGSRDIAEFLIGQGARMDLFTAVMLGRLDIVTPMLTAYPALLQSRGPHGLSLDPSRPRGRRARTRRARLSRTPRSLVTLGLKICVIRSIVNLQSAICNLQYIPPVPPLSLAPRRARVARRGHGRLRASGPCRRGASGRQDPHRAHRRLPGALSDAGAVQVLRGPRRLANRAPGGAGSHHRRPRRRGLGRERPDSQVERRDARNGHRRRSSDTSRRNSSDATRPTSPARMR